MKDKERRQYEMLLRIRDFGNTNRDVFAQSPAAVETFESLNATVNDLAATDTRKMSARVASRADRKAKARQTLIKLLVRVGQLARVLRARGQTLPSFALPRSSSDQGWLTIARHFARDAALFEAEFSGHGIGPAVIDSVAAAFDASVRDREMKRADHLEARARIHSLIASALLDARRLDVIITNKLAYDNVTRAVWKQERRVHRPRRPGSGAAPVDEPMPAKVIPMTGVA
jgi:hypothetical protein